MNPAPTSAQCRQLADEHKVRAKEAGISSKLVTLHTNIARSYGGLASQLEMLAEHEGEIVKGWVLIHVNPDGMGGRS